MSTARPTSASARPQGPGPRPDQGVQGATRPTPTAGPSGWRGHWGHPAAAARSRRVKLTVSRVDPWSAMKMSFLISVALGDRRRGHGGGAVDDPVRHGRLLRDQPPGGLGAAGRPEPVHLMDFLGFGRVLSLSIVIGVIDIILMTALSTLGAFLYNICSGARRRPPAHADRRLSRSHAASHRF